MKPTGKFKTTITVPTEIFDLYLDHLRPEQRFVDPEIEEENIYLIDKEGRLICPLVRKDK